MLDGSGPRKVVTVLTSVCPDPKTTFHPVVFTVVAEMFWISSSSVLPVSTSVMAMRAPVPVEVKRPEGSVKLRSRQLVPISPVGM